MFAQNNAVQKIAKHSTDFNTIKIYDNYDPAQGELYIRKHPFRGHSLEVLKAAKTNGNSFKKTLSKATHKIEEFWLKFLVKLHIVEKGSAKIAEFVEETRYRIQLLNEDTDVSAVAAQILGLDPQDPTVDSRQLQELYNENSDMFARFIAAAFDEQDDETALQTLKQLRDRVVQSSNNQNDESDNENVNGTGNWSPQQ